MANELVDSTAWAVSPLKGVVLQNQFEVSLDHEITLMRADERLLAARTHLLMSKLEFEEIGNSQWFLVLRIPQSLSSPVYLPNTAELLLDALMAFQIVKPVETYGYVVSGIEFADGSINWQHYSRRWPMNSGLWAHRRSFDEPLLNDVRAIMNSVRRVMKGPDIAKRNAVHLLLLALEQPHPYIACLLAVTGIDAILQCEDKRDFEVKLSEFLGESALAFPDWNSPNFPPLKYTVKELAVHLYTLRSKIAHGANLMSAAQDKTSPVDLSELKEYIPEGEPVSYATLLSESSIYLLARVLQKVVGESS